MEKELIHKELSESIIGAAMTVPSSIAKLLLLLPKRILLKCWATLISLACG